MYDYGPEVSRPEAKHVLMHINIYKYIYIFSELRLIKPQSMASFQLLSLSTAFLDLKYSL